MRRHAPWLARHLTAEQRAAAFFPEVGVKGDVGDLAQAFERHAEDALWNSDLKENLRKAIMLLDCALPHFKMQARRVIRRNIAEFLESVTIPPGSVGTTGPRSPKTSRLCARPTRTCRPPTTSTRSSWPAISRTHRRRAS